MTYEPPIPQLERLLQVTVTLDPALEVGTLSVGARRIINITGGHFTGRHAKGTAMMGKVLPGGADWQLVRPDGVAVLEARYTLQTDDGALIYVQNRGLRHGPPDVLAAVARGEDVDPASYYMRTHARLETGDPRYGWVNTTLFVGTGARTGLVCIAVFGVLLMRQVKYRFLIAGLGAVAVVAATPFLPQEYKERMETITGFRSDESASTRIEVWKWTYHYVLANPTGGGFDAYRGNSFTYEIPDVEGEGNNRRVTYREITDQARAYHSSYFEVLGEQGWLGLFLWLSLQVLGLYQMERIRWREGKKRPDRDIFMFDLATALQHAQIIFLVGALFVGIAFQSFVFILLAFQAALWSQWRQKRRGFEPSPVAAKLAETRRAATA